MKKSACRNHKVLSTDLMHAQRLDQQSNTAHDQINRQQIMKGQHRNRRHEQEEDSNQDRKYRTDHDRRRIHQVIKSQMSSP